MPSFIRDIANRYRVERVAFDVAVAVYNANADDASELASRLALNEAFDRCKALAEALALLQAVSDDDRDDQRTIAFDIAVMEGRQ